MRARVAALRAELRRTTAERREAMAAELYDTEALRQRMMTEAGAGREAVTVLGFPGVDLRETAAAQEAVVWLKSTGLAHRWDMRSGDAAGAAADLVIEWREVMSA